MKRIYLSLLGALMALSASAQLTWVCDSAYAVDASNGQRIVFHEYSYENGVLMEKYIMLRGEYSYDDSGTIVADGDGLSMWKYTKEVYGYDDAGRINKISEYEKVGDNWKLITVRDYVSFNENGDLVEIIDYDVATTREAFGQTYVSTYTYEYDDHGGKSKEVLESDDHNYIMTFENNYDANGNLISDTEYYNGKVDNIAYYFYSLGGHTAIKGVKASAGAANGWFDLNGRRINGQPTKKGLYIHDGRKVLIK